MEITQIDDMQIVNGGQTSSAIYFAPKDKQNSKWWCVEGHKFK